MRETRVIKMNQKILNQGALEEAVVTLERGGLVVFPTETVYGIAANLLNQKALERLRDVKERPIDKQFSVHVASIVDVEKYAIDILPRAYKMMNHFWPGPLTLVLPAPGAKSVGLRMPNNAVALALLSRVDFPVIAPSANLKDRPAPRDADTVLKELNGRVDLILDSGPTELGVESTVLDARTLPFGILREGYLKKNEVFKVARQKTVLFVCTGNSCRSVMAEYLLKKRLQDLKRDDVEVISAGTCALVGMGPTQETLKLVSTLGLDASGHCAQRAGLELVNGADVIFAMERRHIEDLVRYAPKAAGRIHLLGEYRKSDSYEDEIADPIGKSQEFYASVFYKMKSALDKLGESL